MQLKSIMSGFESPMYTSLPSDYIWQANQVMASIWQAILSLYRAWMDKAPLTNLIFLHRLCP